MSQKIENMLNLALETPEQVREQTENLNVGFDSRERTWEVIVKYHGSLEALEQEGVEVERLIAGYAILTVPEGKVEQVAAREEIEYMEKPKRFFYSLEEAKAFSCIYPATLREPYLTGEGTLVAVIDSGDGGRLVQRPGGG